MAMASSLGNLYVTLSADTSRFMTSMNNVEKRLQQTSAKMIATGTKMSLALTAPLTLFGRKAVKSFSEFDDAMTKSLAIMDGITPEIRKQMGDLAKEMSTNTVTSASELGRSYFYLASAGMDAARSMKNLSTVNTFAIAGNFEMALATDLLTDAQTAMGMSSEDLAQDMANLTKIADVFVRANTSANTSVQQVSEAMTADAGTAARQMGMSLESTVAVLDAYASAGKKGAEAGNLFGRATRLLTGAQRKHGDVFKKYGIEVIDASTGEYRDFIDIISDMEKAFANMKKPMRDAALEQMGFETLAQKSITPLLGLGNAMKTYRNQLKAAGGESARVAEENMKSFSAQMQILKNRIELVTMEIGERLAPYIFKLSKTINYLIKVWKGLSDSFKDTLVLVGLIVAAIGPLLLTFGIMAGMMAKVIGLGTWLGGVVEVAFLKLSAVFGVLKAAMLALFSPMGIAIAVATIAFGVLIYRIVKFTDLGNTAFKRLQTIMAGFAGRFKKTFGVIYDMLADAKWGAAAKLAWAYIAMEFWRGVTSVAETIGWLYDDMVMVFRAMVSLGAKAMGGIARYLLIMAQGLSTALTTVFTFISKTFWSMIEGLAKGLVWLVQKALRAAKEAGIISQGAFTVAYSKVAKVGKGVEGFAEGQRIQGGASFRAISDAISRALEDQRVKSGAYWDEKAETDSRQTPLAKQAAGALSVAISQWKNAMTEADKVKAATAVAEAAAAKTEQKKETVGGVVPPAEEKPGLAMGSFLAANLMGVGAVGKGDPIQKEQLTTQKAQLETQKATLKLTKEDRELMKKTAEFQGMTIVVGS